MHSESATQMTRSTSAGRGVPRHRSAIGALAFLAVPVLVLVSVWLPLLAHYRVPETDPTPSMVETARTLPGDDVLQELRRFYLLPIAGRSAAFEVSAAEEILQGRLELPGTPAGQLHVPPEPGDLGRLPAELQLSYAGFVVPDLLLAAYTDSGREEFFAAAEAFIASWDRYERQSLGPQGLLWNDHAISARVRVLAEFWRIYRARPDYRPDVGRAVLTQAARYGSLLSSPEQFTFATNHGIMQNLGLLLLSLSFPTLPDRERYHAIALERFGGQLAFLIDEAGVVRENSAGYQAFDLALLGMTYRCMTLLGDPIPEDWARRYAAGLGVLDDLRRPDGTIPTVGDTDEASLGEYPPTTRIDASGLAAPLLPFTGQPPRAPETLDASSGYWINWEGLDHWPDTTSQTVVTWTSPPGPGHKHADELGVMVWSDGISWLTSAGYWPYADAGGLLAESWVGANAPHLEGEASTSLRQTELLAHGRADQVAAVDLERDGPGAYRVRRQVVHVGTNLWIVLDVTSGGDAASQSTWTISPEVELRPAESAGSYLLEARTAGASARLDYVGSPAPTFAEYQGSLAPFAGWHVVGGTPQPAPAVIVDQPAGPAWLATVVARTGGSTSEDRVTGRPTAMRVDSAEDWAMAVPTTGGGLEIRRTGRTIVVDRPGAPGGSPASVDVAPGPDARPEQARIRAAFDAMASAYPQFQPLVSRRTTVSIGILLLTLGQEAVLLVVRRRRRGLYLPLRALGTVCWIALAVWLGLVFLRSWEVTHLAA
jgi:hypothetical protein